MKIQILSKDASKGFSFLAGINRPINPSQVSKLAESVEFFGEVIRPVVVADVTCLPGGTKKYIIDGQHLYNALIRQKRDIPYINIGKINTLENLIEKIALLNSTSKPWTLDDYVTTWSYYKEEYQTFISLFQTHNIERGTLAELLHTGLVTAYSGGTNRASVTKVLKNGQLRILNLQLATEVLDYISDLRPIIKDLGRHEQKLVIATIISKIKADGSTYNHKAYKTYLAKNKEKIILASNDIEAVRRLLQN